MGKNPAFQFYPNDWLRDLAACTLNARGLWITLLSHMWYAERKGILSMSIRNFCCLCGCQIDEFLDAINELNELKICEVKDQNGVTSNAKITDGNKKITVKNRRMYKEYKANESNKLRQAKHRNNKKSNNEITPPSSSSSSSSSSLKEIYKEKCVENPPQKECEFYKNNPQEKIPLVDYEQVCKKLGLQYNFAQDQVEWESLKPCWHELEQAANETKQKIKTPRLAYALTIVSSIREKPKSRASPNSFKKFSGYNPVPKINTEDACWIGDME